MQRALTPHPLDRDVERSLGQSALLTPLAHMSTDQSKMAHGWQRLPMTRRLLRRLRPLVLRRVPAALLLEAEPGTEPGRGPARARVGSFWLAVFVARDVG